MDKELRKAFEETTRNNVNAVIEYSKTTRDIVRTLEDQINSLNGDVQDLKAQIDGIKLQLSGIQVKLFSGGTE